MRSAQTERFYKDILKYPPKECGVIGLRLTRNSERIAGCICLLSKTLEVFIAGCPAKSSQSPLPLLYDELVKLAHAEVKDLDFRMAGLEHGLHGLPATDLSDPRSSYVLAVGARGRPGVIRKQIDSIVRQARRLLKPNFDHLPLGAEPLP
jgi:hypothetical protein